MTSKTCYHCIENILVFFDFFCDDKGILDNKKATSNDTYKSFNILLRPQKKSKNNFIVFRCKDTYYQYKNNYT